MDCFNSRHILDRYLPPDVMGLTHEDLAPAHTVDQMAFHRCLIHYIVRKPFSPSWADGAARAPHVANVDRLYNDRGQEIGFVAEIASDLDLYWQSIRYITNTWTLYEPENTPIIWYIRFSTGRASRTIKPVTEAMRALGRENVHWFAEKASAHILRDLLITAINTNDQDLWERFNDVISPLRSERGHQWHLRHLLSKGEGQWHLITRVPTSVRLVLLNRSAPASRNHVAAVFHDTIMGYGPWLLTSPDNTNPLRHLKSHARELGGEAPRIILSLQIEPCETICPPDNWRLPKVYRLDLPWDAPSVRVTKSYSCSASGLWLPYPPPISLKNLLERWICSRGQFSTRNTPRIPTLCCDKYSF